MVAAIFPGQGSQKPGMGKALFDASPAARAIFERVRAATSLDVAKLCFESDEDTLRQTQNAQIALYTCGLAAFAAFRETATTAFNAAAGHSVGEYAALAAAEVVDLENGARLVQRRGELMSQVGGERPGAMAAVIGLDRELTELACDEASTGGEAAVIANDNSPGQLVISGDRAAVVRASSLATAKGARRVLPLNVSGAFHSPLMEAAAKSMGSALRESAFGSAHFPVYANVTAQRQDDPELWPELLEEQLRRPVRWTETIRQMAADGIRTFVEFGSGEVLSGLVRRIEPEAATLAVSDPASLAAAQEALAGIKVEA